jgi:putative membrane protein
MMRHLAIGAAFAALALLPAAAQTQKGTSSQSVDQNTRQFVEKAANGDMFEIQSSKLASERSKNDRIRQFAERLLKDHSQSTTHLSSVIKNVQGLELPAQMDKEHQDKLAKLSAATGAGFDQQFRSMQIEAHQTAVQLFENYARSGSNQDLKSFAEKTVPTLREHLKMAQQLPEASSPGTAAAPGTGSNQQASSQASSKVIASPSLDQMLASDLRGTEVKGANNEDVGDINDILLGRDGRIVAVIVGVGGFLGIGEKNVAIPFEALQIEGDQRATGTTGAGAQGTLQPNRIVLRGMTKSDLEAAPRFQENGARTNTNDQPAPRPNR